MPRPPVFATGSTLYTTPHEVVAAFYVAFEQRNLEAMMALWAEDEDILCIHPGHTPLVGYAAVRASWRALFEGTGQLRFDVRNPWWHSTIGMATHGALEWVHVNGEEHSRGPVAVTKVLLRTPQGWRLLSHHGSPVAAQATHAAPGTVWH